MRNLPARARGIHARDPRNPAQERETGRSRGFGFVVMSHTTTAHDLLKTSHYVDGRKLNLSLATPEGAGGAPGGSVGTGTGARNLAPPEPGAVKLYLGDLLTQTTEDEINHAFTVFGSVRECMIMRHSDTRESRGFGFVTYNEPAGAQSAVNAGELRVGRALVKVRAVERPCCECKQ